MTAKVAQKCRKTKIANKNRFHLRPLWLALPRDILCRLVVCCTVVHTSKLSSHLNNWVVYAIGLGTLKIQCMQSS